MTMVQIFSAIHAKERPKTNVKPGVLKLANKSLSGAKVEGKSHVMKEQRVVNTLVRSATKSAQVASLYHALMAQMSSATDV